MMKLQAKITVPHGHTWYALEELGFEVSSWLEDLVQPTEVELGCKYFSLPMRFNPTVE